MKTKLKQNSKAIFTALCLLLISSTVFAHKDFCRAYQVKNVTSRIKTGYNYEIINKSFIAAKLISSLADSLSYGNPIYIDFEHAYTTTLLNRYGVGENVIYQCGDDLDKRLDHGDTLISRPIVSLNIVGQDYDFIKLLQIAEFYLVNKDSLTTSQISFWRYYFRSPIQTADRSLLNRVLRKSPSELVLSVLNQTIEIPDIGEGEFLYTWHNGKFILQEIDWFSNEIDILDTIDNIIQLYRHEHLLFVFTTDSTFNFYNPSFKTKYRSISLRGLPNRSYRPYDLFEISFDRFSINAKGRVSIFSYYRHEDRFGLVQDLDELLERYMGDR